MVISLLEFDNLSEKDRKKTLQELKSEIGVSGLVEAWSVSRAKIYSMLHELNVPVNPRKPRKAGEEAPSGSSHPHGKRSRNKGKDENNEKTIPEYAQSYQVLNADGPKFTLSLDTQGEASAISQTIQLLLSSGKFEHTNLHINLRLEEV